MSAESEVVYLAEVAGLARPWLEGQDPAGQDYTGCRTFLAASGSRELTRTKRGWTRTRTSNDTIVGAYTHLSDGSRNER